MSVIIAQSPKNPNAFSNIFAEETLENFFVSALYCYSYCIYFLESAKLACQLSFTQPCRVDRMEKKELVTEEKNDFTVLYDYLPSISWRDQQPWKLFFLFENFFSFDWTQYWSSTEGYQVLIVVLLGQCNILGGSIQLAQIILQGKFLWLFSARNFQL